MSFYGSFESMGEVRPRKLGVRLRAAKPIMGESAEALLIKAFQPPISLSADDAKWQRDQFVQRAQFQKLLHESDPAHWGPIYDAGIAHDEAFYVTRHYPKSVGQMLEDEIRLNYLQIRIILSEVTAALQIVSKSRSRGHGQIQAGKILIERFIAPGQILLCDPLTDNYSRSVTSARDLYDIGKLLYLLVVGREFQIVENLAEFDPRVWQMPGRHGKVWFDLCKRLIEQNEPHLTLDALADELSQIGKAQGRPSTALIGLAGAAVAVALPAIAIWWYSQSGNSSTSIVRMSDTIAHTEPRSDESTARETAAVAATQSNESLPTPATQPVETVSASIEPLPPDPRNTAAWTESLQTGRSDAHALADRFTAANQTVPDDLKQFLDESDGLARRVNDASRKAYSFETRTEVQTLADAITRDLSNLANRWTTGREKWNGEIAAIEKQFEEDRQARVESEEAGRVRVAALQTFDQQAASLKLDQDALQAVLVNKIAEIRGQLDQIGLDEARSQLQATFDKLASLSAALNAAPFAKADPLVAGNSPLARQLASLVQPRLEAAHAAARNAAINQLASDLKPLFADYDRLRAAAAKGIEQIAERQALFEIGLMQDATLLDLLPQLQDAEVIRIVRPAVESAEKSINATREAVQKVEADLDLARIAGLSKAATTQLPIRIAAAQREWALRGIADESGWRDMLAMRDAILKDVRSRAAATARPTATATAKADQLDAKLSRTCGDVLAKTAPHALKRAFRQRGTKDDAFRRQLELTLGSEWRDRLGIRDVQSLLDTVVLMSQDGFGELRRREADDVIDALNPVHSAVPGLCLPQSNIDWLRDSVVDHVDIVFFAPNATAAKGAEGRRIAEEISQRLGYRAMRGDSGEFKLQKGEAVIRITEIRIEGKLAIKIIVDDS